MSVSAVRAFLVLSRPHFLLGGGLMFALGALAADRIDGTRYMVAQVMVTATQLTAHYVNEYADVDADRAVANRTMFSGGSGVLASGLLRPRIALTAAFATSALAVLAAGLLAVDGPLASALGAVALAVSWSYSMPPARLLGTGWGEVVTSLTVAGLTPLVGVTAMGSSPPPGLWWAIAILVPLHLAMMLVFELPDLESDALVGKRVLAVRLGERRAQVLLAVCGGMGALTGLAASASGAVPGAASAIAAGTVPATLVAFAVGRHWHAVSTSAAVATLVVVNACLVLSFAN